MDDLELFGGNPLSKWKDVIFNASPTLVSIELERLLEELASFELFLESKGLSVEEARRFARSADKSQIESLKNNIAIESMGNILSNHE